MIVAALKLIEGDCTKALKKLPAGSFSAVVCDPIYPGIDRDYGRMTEAEWHAMMDIVVPECRRVLEPTGSAVFILQPNSKRVGEMRLWLYEFILKWGREWGLVQDAYWWNYATLPKGGATQKGMLRSSVKLCVWLGAHDCYRDQDAVLWDESEQNAKRRHAHELGTRAGLFSSPSAKRSGSESARLDATRAYGASAKRGGVTPFNLLPASNTSTQRVIDVSGFTPHPARTPTEIVDFWVRYLCPAGGSVLDPFVGSGTTLWVAEEHELSATGIEKDARYAAQVRSQLSSLTKS